MEMNLQPSYLHVAEINIIISYSEAGTELLSENKWALPLALFLLVYLQHTSN